MTKKEKLLELRADAQMHYNCAQSVLIPFAEELGITEAQACALAANFGGGMGCGSACGALIGAMMVLGGLGAAQEKRTELLRRFREENGAIDCAALIKAAVARGEERKVHCDRIIEEALGFVCAATCR